MTTTFSPGAPALVAGHQLARIGMTQLGAADFGSDGDITTLAAFWNELPVDPHTFDGSTYRRRRYGESLAVPTDSGWALEPLPNRAFRQAADVVPLYGGRPREFAPLPDGLLDDEALRNILAFDLAAITHATGQLRTHFVGLHLIRVEAGIGEAHAPAPEGRHRDGHDFVAMHLVDRVDCDGGRSLVFRPDEPTAFHDTTLQAPLDTLIIDDRRVEHAVTDVSAVHRLAVRDLLIVDFESPVLHLE